MSFIGNLTSLLSSLALKSSRGLCPSGPTPTLGLPSIHAMRCSFVACLYTTVQLIEVERSSVDRGPECDLQTTV
ncbi:hypothetical protein GGI35DRAFT_237573 [Trichoderma velutinum]